MNGIMNSFVCYGDSYVCPLLATDAALLFGQTVYIDLGKHVLLQIEVRVFIQRFPIFREREREVGWFSDWARYIAPTTICTGCLIGSMSFSQTSPAGSLLAVTLLSEKIFI